MQKAGLPLLCGNGGSTPAMFATIRQLQELYRKYGQDYSTGYPYDSSNSGVSYSSYGEGDFDGQSSGHDFYGVSFPLRLCCSRWDGRDVRRGARKTEGARGGADGERARCNAATAGRTQHSAQYPPPSAVREECSRTGEQPLARARPVCSSMRRRPAGNGARARDGRETAALTTLRCGASRGV